MPGYAPEQHARILALLLARRAAGESFDAIAATPGWPSRPTLRKWLRGRPDLRVPTLRRVGVRWSPQLANRICRRVLGGESLRAICRGPAMPDRKTLDLWRRTRPGFAARLADARARAGHARTGRHSTCCPAVVQGIFDRLAAGATLADICAAPGMPAPRTVRDWAHADPRVAYALDLGRQIGRETQAEAYFPMLADLPREAAGGGKPPQPTPNPPPQGEGDREAVEGAAE